MENTEQSIRGMWDIVKIPKMPLIRVPKREARERMRQKQYFKR